jgi:hypothetical protein
MKAGAEAAKEVANKPKGEVEDLEEVRELKRKG